MYNIFITEKGRRWLRDISMTPYHSKYFLFYIEKEEIDRIGRGEEFSHKLGWEKTWNKTFHGKAYRQEI